MSAPVLSVVILNYKNPRLTQRCVEQALDATRAAGVPSEIIVVDNSGPETGETLRAVLRDPAVRLILNERNVGFAAGNNQGIQVARGEYLLLLNNDAFLEVQALIAGLDYLIHHDDTAIWAPALVGEDGSLQTSAAPLPSLGQLVGEYWWLGKWKKLLPASWQMPLQSNVPRTVPSVIGAFFLMPKKVIEQVGLLDEDYFFTVEDVDYCRRVGEQKLRIVLDQRHTIVHIGSASQGGRAWFQDPYMHQHRLLYFRKHHPRWQQAVAYCVIQSGLGLRRAWHRLRTT
ncbi:hypothetical protein HNR42_001027 [Deinobacterium chartae]|uniref:Glycosyltransferase 2-like domain-containing protein n=1 Tax=Deinobacterium chartae TaxID=521158 RepID=A0A841HZI0_9DEIO|nr:hypothetical protein [Deinobacterium chartae]